MWVSWSAKLGKHSRLHLRRKITVKNFWYYGLLAMVYAIFYYCLLAAAWLFFGVFWLIWQCIKWPCVLLWRGVRALFRLIRGKKNA